MALILVLDDSPLFRAVISKVVQEEDYEVLEARNGFEGLQMITSHKPDCILLDLLMPVMGGIEFLKAFRDKGYNIPIIVITTETEASIRKQCLELGAAGFINKPIDGNELKAEIKKVLVNKEEIKIKP